MNLYPGMTYTLEREAVFEDNTLSFGRIGLESLLSTSTLVAMMIEAAVNLVGENIGEGDISVVKDMKISHENPTPQGKRVSIEAKLDKIEANRLYFSFVCYDDGGRIATGEQERHIVKKEALINRASARMGIML